MINFVAIGQRIKYFRKKYCLTQEKLAEMIDMSTEHLSRIENGSDRPSITFIEKISELFNVDESELMFGTSEKTGIDNELYSRIQMLTDEKKQAILNVIDLMK